MVTWSYFGRVMGKGTIGVLTIIMDKLDTKTVGRALGALFDQGGL